MKICLLLCVLWMLIDTKTSLSLRRSIVAHKSTKSTSLSMSYFSFPLASSRLADVFGIMPLCIKATSKSTTINDPMAGMNPEEIRNYLDNVGGGMCGYPDIVRTFIGLGLNLSLILFGLFTVSYVVVGGATFVMEKKVDDLLKAQESKYPELKKDLQSIQFQTENDDGSDISSSDFDLPLPKKLSAGEKPPVGPNRSERRFKGKINKKD